jgi:hypothetical protein
VHKKGEGIVISLRPNPIVNVNANVLKLVSCMTSFYMHISWYSACMYCVVKGGSVHIPGYRAQQLECARL